MTEKTPFDDRPLVLVVDDSRLFREMIEHFLETIGYTARLAVDGREAVEIVADCRPELVLMDAHMPELDGFAACAEIKSRPATRDLPIIMVTGLHDDASVDRAFDAGADEFVTKPVHWAVLRQRIRLLIEAFRAEKRKMRMEIERRQAAKMEALGVMAGGIAHEINTPAQYVWDNIRFLEGAFKDLETVVRESRGGRDATGQDTDDADDDDTEYLLEEIPLALEHALDGVERIRQIVAAVREFSHPDGKTKVLVDLNHSIETAITVTRGQWKHVADVETDLDDTLPQVPCLAGELNQVFLNLIVNAVHAIEDVGDAKGRIRISTRRTDDWAEVRVSDSGCGIPTEMQHRIFDPFFTTKEPGRGTGQGLAICHAVVTKRHGGAIALESECGNGTSFTVRLPFDEKRNNDEMGDAAE